MIVPHVVVGKVLVNLLLVLRLVQKYVGAGAIQINFLRFDKFFLKLLHRIQIFDDLNLLLTFYNSLADASLILLDDLAELCLLLLDLIKLCQLGGELLIGHLFDGLGKILHSFHLRLDLCQVLLLIEAVHGETLVAIRHAPLEALNLRVMLLIDVRDAVEFLLLFVGHGEHFGRRLLYCPLEVIALHEAQ